MTITAVVYCMATDKSAKSLKEQWVCQLCRPMELATISNKILAEKASCMDMSALITN